MSRSPPPSMHIIEYLLTMRIKDATKDVNHYHKMGWDPEWPSFLRHLYLEGLLKHQLENFDKT